MTILDDELLIEAAAAAWRPRARASEGAVAFHPAWHDLDAAGREEAFEVARRMRTIEAAVDARGLSTTGRAVMARIRGGSMR